jgi:hypothetical protein
MDTQVNKVEEIQWVFVSLIVPNSVVEAIRRMTSSVGPSGEGMFQVPLSSDGKLPATHWVSSGMIGKEFYDLMLDHQAMSERFNVPLEQVDFLMKDCVISELSVHELLSELSLSLVQVDEQSEVSLA